MSEATAQTTTAVVEHDIHTTAHWLTRIERAMLAAVLVLLPFEPHLGAIPIRGFTVTGLEVAYLAAIGAWALRLAYTRRRPTLARPVVLLLGALFVVWVISAATASGHNDEAFKFILRSAAAWILFVAIADSVANGTEAKLLVGALFVGAVVSASLGLLALGIGRPVSLWLGQWFYTGDVVRIQGTLVYPTVAGMYWAAAAIAGIGLLLTTDSRRTRLAVLVAIALLVVATILTLSRGSTLGMVCGVAVLGVAALVARRHRLAIYAFVGSVGILALAVFVQASLLTAGRLFEEGNGAFYTATYDVPSVIRPEPGERIDVPVRVTNTGFDTWNERFGGMKLGYRWLDPESGEMLMYGDKSPITGVIPPGESATLLVPLEAPERAGSYVVAWDAIEPDGTWFGDEGVPVATTALLVGAATADDLPVVPPEIKLSESTDRPDRAVLWAAAVAMVGERPLLGQGPGTFHLLYGEYAGIAEPDESIHSNSLYLELAATTGLIGLALFVVLVGYILWHLARSMRSTTESARNRAEWPIRATLLAAICACLVASLVDYFLSSNSTGGQFWALLGIGLGMVRGR